MGWIAEHHCWILCKKLLKQTKFFTYFQYLSQRFKTVYLEWPKFNLKMKKKPQSVWIWFIPPASKHSWIEVLPIQITIIFLVIYEQRWTAKLALLAAFIHFLAPHSHKEIAFCHQKHTVQCFPATLFGLQCFNQKLKNIASKLKFK